MSDRANPGPEYMRATEWGAIRSRRSRKRFFVGLAMSGVAAAAALWWVQAPSLRNLAELRGAAAHIQEARNSHVAAYSVGPDNARVIAWEEWRVGDRSRVQIERTGAVLVHSIDQDIAFDPFTMTARDQRYAKRDIDGRALITSFFEEAIAAPSLVRLPSVQSDGKRLSVFRFEQGRERFHCWIEEQTQRPVGCFVEIHTPDGWVPTHEFSVDLATPVMAGLLGLVPPDGVVRYDLLDPKSPLHQPSRVVAEVPIGQRGAIQFGAVEMNSEGVLFIVLHSAGAVPPVVTDDLGTVYFRDGEGLEWPSIPATELLYVPMERRPGEFSARTVTLRFPQRSATSNNWPSRDLASYEVRFEKPSCAAAPMYRQTTHGADYAALYKAETVRGRHLARVVRTQSGRVIDALSAPSGGGNDRMQVTTVNQDDLFAAARAYRRALALYRESGVYTGATPASVWFRLFELVQSHGEPEDAERIIQSAEAALDDRRHEPDESDIRLNARSYRKKQ